MIFHNKYDDTYIFCKSTAITSSSFSTYIYKTSQVGDGR